MTANFEFLAPQKEYALFSAACADAERVLTASPVMCAAGCRKALELAVKWVYAADNTMKTPYKDNLQALLHEPSFRFAVVRATWGKLPYIVKLGNLAVHTDKGVSRGDAVLALSGLFEFVQWIDYSYGQNYEERTFAETRLPGEKIVVDERKIKEQESLLNQKDSELEALRKKIEEMSASFTARKERYKEERVFTAADDSEFGARKRYIDVDLKLLGWSFGEDVREEVKIPDMAGVPGQTGFADYVLYGKDGLPLAVLEAKRASKDPNAGKQQARLYADSLEKQCGRRPMMFTSNGFETYFWDDLAFPQRQVSGIFSRDDLQKLMNRREARGEPSQTAIDDKITDRYYQKEAIRAVCDHIRQGHRKSLLVMATGTGKTRVAASLTDVLSRAGQVTNVLFLADRVSLVAQAKDAFHGYLPEMSLCNLLSNKNDKNARVVFSTYPTMLNAIDSEKNERGSRFFTPAYFDLIIIDEAHRSIFRKYRAIFEYFDACLVGLTATPKTDVDRNTYDFFEMEPGVPTYAYEYDTAVNVDHVLVPYFNIETTTKFLEDGITYDELSDEDKQRYEEDFTDEDGEMPDFIPSPKLNQVIFNRQTVDMVLEDLMTRGIKTEGGDKTGKTIIFAQNKRHAQYIVERFDILYPHLKGSFASRVVCDDAYAQTIINNFKRPEKEPQIAVSVDMMDTGLDVPEVVNLVFFKKIHSKTKFWQMIGRGTRLCENLECLDSQDGFYVDKRRFYIFDYLGNFEFFRARRDGVDGSEIHSLSEEIFIKRVRLIHALQESAFAEETYQNWRETLVVVILAQIQELNAELTSVRLKRRYVERYKNPEAFVRISEQDKYDLSKNLAPLVYMDDADEQAKRFDNFMYGLILERLEASSAFTKLKNQLCKLCAALEKRATIPQIKEKLPLIQAVAAGEFLSAAGILTFERVREELRGLIKFLADDVKSQRFIYTNLTDEIVGVKEGETLYSQEDFADYRAKVNHYINTHTDHIAIYKLRNNIRLTESDYQALSDILTQELGNEEDYRRAYQDLPFGLLVRRIAKMEREAAMKVFSEFISDQYLNQEQIVFVNKIVDYIAQNGYIDSPKVLTQAPFDKPRNFIRLFDDAKQKKIVALFGEIRDNAVNVG